MDDLLLMRFIEQDVTIEEARQVLRWMEQSEANRARFAELQTLWAATLIDAPHETNDRAVKKIVGRIRKKDKKKMSLFLYYAAAACVIAVIAAGIAVWNTWEKNFDYEAAVRQFSCGDKIILKIGGKEEIRCAEAMVKILHNHRQTVINDTIEFIDRERREPNVLYVPYGKRAELLLSDGTMIYLNSGSTLIYPSCFTTRRREVYLDGEAYFDVSRDESRAFVVKTLYRSVEVLGTKFNVSVDREFQTFETMLVNGSVMIKGDATDELLRPDQYYIFSDQTKIEEVRTVDATCYTSWIENRLQFKKEKLYKAIRKLEKTYDIRIELMDRQYLNYQVSGQLNLRNSAEETVRMLMETVAPEKLIDEKAFYKIKHNH